jgi:hypothetical protein
LGRPDDREWIGTVGIRLAEVQDTVVREARDLQPAYWGRFRAMK